jgi:hypothetical protein
MEAWFAVCDAFSSVPPFQIRRVLVGRKPVVELDRDSGPRRSVIR